MNEKEHNQKMQRIQLIEQNIQNFLMQKQSLISTQAEIDSALSELEKTTNAYKIVGNIMVNAEKSELKKELEEKKKVIDMRLNSIEKQETKLTTELKELQEEILK